MNDIETFGWYQEAALKAAELEQRLQEAHAERERAARLFADSEFPPELDDELDD